MSTTYSYVAYLSSGTNSDNYLNEVVFTPAGAATTGNVLKVFFDTNYLLERNDTILLRIAEAGATFQWKWEFDLFYKAPIALPDSTDPHELLDHNNSDAPTGIRVWFNTPADTILSDMWTLSINSNTQIRPNSVMRFSWHDAEGSDVDTQSEMSAYPLVARTIGATTLTADPCSTLLYGTSSSSSSSPLGYVALTDTVSSTELGENASVMYMSSASGGQSVVSIGDGFFYRPTTDTTQSSFSVVYAGSAPMSFTEDNGAILSDVTTDTKPYQKVGWDAATGRVAILGGTTSTSFLSVVTLKTPAVLAVDVDAYTITLSDTTGVVVGAKIALGAPEREYYSREATVESVNGSVVTLSGSPTLTTEMTRVVTGWPEPAGTLLDEAVSDISWPSGYTVDIGKSYTLAVAGDYVYCVLTEDAGDTSLTTFLRRTTMTCSIARIHTSTGATENVVTGLADRTTIGWTLPPITSIPSTDGESTALLYGDTTTYDLMMLEDAGGTTLGTPFSLGRPQDTGIYAFTIATAPLPDFCASTPEPSPSPCEKCIECTPAPGCVGTTSSRNPAARPLAIILLVLVLGIVMCGVVMLIRTRKE